MEYGKIKETNMYTTFFSMLIIEFYCCCFIYKDDFTSFINFNDLLGNSDVFLKEISTSRDFQRFVDQFPSLLKLGCWWLIINKTIY